MQIQIQITSDKMVHASPAQFGAIVAHVMKSKHFHRVIVHKTWIEVMFNVGDYSSLVGAMAQGPALEKDVIGLLDLEPFPCPCNCGQFLAIGPCFEQSGEMVRGAALNENEKRLVAGRDKIGAIRSIRERIFTVNPDGSKSHMGLKDAKDLCDLYEKTLSR